MSSYNNASLLYHFPIDIYRYLAIFLLTKEHHAFLQTCKAITLTHIKKQSIFYPLNEHYSKQYYENLNDCFIKIHQQIENPFLQISLQITPPFNHPNTMMMINGILRIASCSFKGEALMLLFPQTVFQMKELVLIEPAITTTTTAAAAAAVVVEDTNHHPLPLNNNNEMNNDSTTIQGIKKLKIRKANQTEQILSLLHHHYCSSFADEQLRLLREVDLVQCDLTHTEQLQYIPSLSFTKCHQLRNIQSLGIYQKKIFFKYSPSITEVNHLSAAEVLTFIDCNGIVDVSGLRQVPQLLIRWCDQITNFSNLQNNSHCLEIASMRINDNKTKYTIQTNTKHLKLSQLYISHLQISDRLQSLQIRSCILPNLFSFLETTFHHLSRIVLHGIFRTTDVSPLRGIHCIKLISCKDLISIAGLAPPPPSIPPSEAETAGKMSGIATTRSTFAIEIDSCFGVKDFSSLRFISQVTIRYGFLPSLEMVKNVHYLTFEQISSFTEFIGWKTLKLLQLKSCSNLKYISNLNHLTTIIVDSCFKLISMTGLSDSYCHVHLNNCQNLEEVHFLGYSLPHMEILNCPKLK